MISLLTKGNNAEHRRPSYDWLSSLSELSARSFESFIFPNQGNLRCTLVEPKLINASTHTFPVLGKSGWLMTAFSYHQQKRWRHRSKRRAKISRSYHTSGPETQTVSLEGSKDKHPRSLHRKKRFRLRLHSISTLRAANEPT